LVSSQRTHHNLTRRGLLASGGAAGAAAFAALNPSVASAITAIGEDPAYLRRSGYARLVGQDFAAGGWGRTVTLTLAEVGDVGKAGRDDAFSLLFVGQAGIESGTQTLRHPSLGSFRLMVSPVDPSGRSQDYEAIVDRSRGLTRRPAPRPPRKRPAPGPTGHHHPPKLVSHAQLRQGRHGVRCEIVLGEHVHAHRAHASLLRDGKPVAISGTRAVHRHRVVLRLTRGRLRRGRYELVVAAGERLQRLPVTLR
jgi:hypothetical protein